MIFLRSVNWFTQPGNRIGTDLFLVHEPNGMSGQTEGEICGFCGQGRVIKRVQEVAFRQLTDKGYVFCRVSVPIGICVQCGVTSLDGMAEAIMDEAVRRAHNKMP